MVTRTIDASTGLLWREGCVGPPVTRTYISHANVEAGHPNWLRANAAWRARAARGPGVAGGPKGTRTAYFYGGGFFPFGRTWGSKRRCAGQAVPDRPARGPGRRKALDARRVPEAVAYRLNRTSITSPSRTR